MLKKMKMKPAWVAPYEHLQAYAKEHAIPEDRFEQTFQTCILLGMSEEQIRTRLDKLIKA